jgi:hypothetical protein
LHRFAAAAKMSRHRHGDPRVVDSSFTNADSFVVVVVVAVVASRANADAVPRRPTVHGGTRNAKSRERASARSIVLIRARRRIPRCRHARSRSTRVVVGEARSIDRRRRRRRRRVSRVRIHVSLRDGRVGRRLRGANLDEFGRRAPA